MTRLTFEQRYITVTYTHENHTLTNKTYQPIHFNNPLLMSADSAQSSETMQRENAFVVSETVGVPRDREAAPLDPEMVKFREAQLKAALLAQAKLGKYTREQAVALGIADCKEFVPRSAGYLKTEHQFECLDEERYVHEKLGTVNGHLYGKCINCGLTEEFLRTKCGSDERPNLYLCSERHKKEAAQKKSFWPAQNKKN